MNRSARLLAALAIALTAPWAVYRLCYLRYRCNLLEAQAERRITALFERSEEMRARIAAREVLETMDRCLPCSPTSLNNYMARAAALRMLGRPAEAAEQYRIALRIDRRSELFLNAGLSELEAGHQQQAEDALITAALVFYSYLEVIPAPMKYQVSAVVDPIYQTIQQHRAPPSMMKELFDRVSRLPKQ